MKNEALMNYVFDDNNILYKAQASGSEHVYISNHIFGLEKKENIDTLKKIGFTVDELGGSVKVSGYKNLVTKQNKEKYAEELAAVEPSKTHKNLGKFLMMGAATIEVAAVAAYTALNHGALPGGVDPGTVAGLVAVAVPLGPLMFMAGRHEHKADYLDQADVIARAKIRDNDFGNGLENDASSSFTDKVMQNIKNIRRNFETNSTIQVLKR